MPALALTYLGKMGVAILGSVGGYLFAPIQQQFNYMCCFNSNITELETQLEVLETTTQGVQLTVEEACRNARVIDPTVDVWRTNANNVTTEAREIIQDKARVKEGCLNGWCGWWPNLMPRYSLSKKAVQKTKSIIELKAASGPYIQPSHSPAPACLGTIPNAGFIGFESRRLKLEQIIEALKHDEINLIGICGMGGAGKTTMAKEVAKRVKEDGLFDEVAMAVVSKLEKNPGQEPDLTDVQDCIADTLGLRSLREQKSSIARADLLRTRLVQDDKRILVILDDIWAQLDLNALGIPLEGTNKKIKMLYTSRTRDLWNNLRTRKKEISLGLLSEDEAWQLFREKAGELADAWDLQPIAKKIVYECGNLPLALVLIGSALSKKSGGNAKDMWGSMLDQLIHASRTPTGDDLYSRLELSYKYLEDDEAKKLFLLCCLFGEDEEICIEDLVRYTFGLSLFDGMNQMGEVRRRVFFIVDDLKSCYLLLDCEREQEERVKVRVKVHDVVRDMGISIASEEKFAVVRHGEISQLPKTGINEPYTAMSLISDKIKELPTGLTYPDLKFLMLRCNELKEIPPNFFEAMENLKVLELKGFRGILTLQSLRNLTTLSLDEFCATLENVSPIGDLLNLEILSIKSSEIKELPKEIGKLVNLKLLDLSDPWSRIRIPPSVISSMIHLEELYVWTRYMYWEGEEKEEEGENANLRELEVLPNLHALEICIGKDVLIPKAPIFSNLTTYKVLIGGGLDLEIRFEKDSNIIKKCKRVLVVKSSIPIPSNRGGIDSLLRSSDCLVLEGEGCNDLVQDICCRPVPVTLFQEKTYIRIEDCGILEQVIWKEHEEDINVATNRSVVFPKLEALTLRKLPNLVDFCRGIDAIDFPQLKTLCLEDIRKLNLLFRCNSNLPSNAERNDNVTLLSLFPQKVSLPSLEVLDVAELQHLVRLGDVQLSVGSLFKLKDVSVRNCGKLLSVFPSQLIPMLQELQKLTVEYCRSLEVLIDWEGLESQETNPEILSALKRVKLNNLPKLNCISKRGFMKYKHIQTLHIEDCNSLRFVFEPTVTKSIPQLRELKILGCMKLSTIVAGENGVGESSVDEVEFPQLEELELRRLPSLVSFFPNANMNGTTLAKSTDHHHNPQLPQPLFKEKDTIPSFEYLVPVGLQSMSSHSFSKLKFFRAMDCANLRNIPFISFFGDLDSTKESLQEVAPRVLLYTHSGNDILAIGSNGIITKMRVDFSLHYPSGKWPGLGGDLSVMKNDVTGVKLKETVPCMALSKDGRCIYSACGGRLSVFDTWISRSGRESFCSAPPGSTFLARHPQDEGIMAIGMEDSTILVYKRFVDKEMSKLRGHRKRITGLSFSPKLHILVSSGADAQLCTWSTDSWSTDYWITEDARQWKSEKLKSVRLQLPTGEVRESDTRVQFHSDGIHLLVSHEAQLAIYDASEMDCVCQWVLQDALPAPISSAVYSCDSQLIYTTFRDGNIRVFDAYSLTVGYHIVPSMYLTPALLSGSQDVYPTVVAAHPKRPNKFAIGLTQGYVILVEPSKSEGQWGLCPTSDNQVARLLYTNSGDGILALGSNGAITQWGWDFSEHDPSGKITSSILPQWRRQWRGPASVLAGMKNDVTGVNLKEAVLPCMALSKDDWFIFLAFYKWTCEEEGTFSSPPPASTFLACHQDKSIMAIGREYFFNTNTILLCNVIQHEDGTLDTSHVISELRGHNNRPKIRITGLSFSTKLNLLVSSGTDAQLCSWSVDTWSTDISEWKSEKLKSIPLQLSTGEVRESDTRVQFHSDGIHLLVSHESQLAIYDVPEMDCIRQWVPQDALPAPISCATYSCDNQFIYATFCDANIGVFDADSLMLRYHITPSMYLDPTLLSRSRDVYPTAIAAHPKMPNKFAIGLRQGSVILMEPPESEGQWVSSPIVDNVMLKETIASSSTTSNDVPD